MATKKQNSSKIVTGAWTREVPVRLSTHRTESWTYHKGRAQQRFQIEATFGKPVALGRIKRKSAFQAEFDSLQARRRFFERLGKFQKIDFCLVCGESLKSAESVARVWRSTYFRCSACGHINSNLRPTDAALGAYYRTNSLGKGYYMDSADAGLRIKQIYSPKIAWAIKAYRSKYGRSPRSMVDIGAGTGHLLAAARKVGIKATGIEIDPKYRKFAEDEFSVTMVTSVQEALRSSPKGYDLVTSFNVIEHVTAPGEFLANYRALSSTQSLSVVETPNFDSYTVWLQTLFPERIRGYLSPYEHIQLFTPESLFTALVENGFVPTHRWGFGQDIRELAFQLFMESKVDHSAYINKHFNKLQAGFDRADFSDLIVVAATPG